MAVEYEYTSHKAKWLEADNAAQDEALSKTGDGIVNAAKRGCPVFLGNLRRGISRTAPQDSTAGRIQREVLIGVAEGNADAFKYAMAVEKGRQAGKKRPPVAALLDWVRRKLHIGQIGVTNVSTRKTRWRNNRQKSSRGTGEFSQGDWAVWDVAFLVARAIGKRGIRARPFFLPAWQREAPKVVNRYKKALAEQIKARGIPDAK